MVKRPSDLTWRVCIYMLVGLSDIEMLYLQLVLALDFGCQPDSLMMTRSFPAICFQSYLGARG